MAESTRSGIPVWVYRDFRKVEVASTGDGVEDVKVEQTARPPTAREYRTPIGKPMTAPEKNCICHEVRHSATASHTASSGYPLAPSLFTTRNRSLPVRKLRATVEVLFDVATTTIDVEWQTDIRSGADLLFLLPLSHGAVVSSCDITAGGRLMRSSVVSLETADDCIRQQREANLAGLVDNDNCHVWVPGVFRAPVKGVVSGSAVRALVTITSSILQHPDWGAFSADDRFFPKEPFKIGPYASVRVPLSFSAQQLDGRSMADVVEVDVCVHSAGRLPYIGSTMPLTILEEGVAAPPLSMEAVLEAVAHENTGVRLEDERDVDALEEAAANGAVGGAGSEEGEESVNGIPAGSRRAALAAFGAGSLLGSATSAMMKVPSLEAKAVGVVRSSATTVIAKVESGRLTSPTDFVLTLPASTPAGDVLWRKQIVVDEESGETVDQWLSVRRDCEDEEEEDGEGAEETEGERVCGAVQSMVLSAVADGDEEGVMAARHTLVALRAPATEAAALPPIPRRIVFAVDAAPSVAGKVLGILLDCVCASIRNLSYEDHFCVMLFNVEGRGTVFATGPMQTASDEGVASATAALLTLGASIGATAEDDGYGASAGGGTLTRAFTMPASTPGARGGDGAATLPPVGGKKGRATVVGHEASVAGGSVAMGRSTQRRLAGRHKKAATGGVSDVLNDALSLLHPVAAKGVENGAERGEGQHEGGKGAAVDVSAGKAAVSSVPATSANSGACAAAGACGASLDASVGVGDGSNGNACNVRVDDVILVTCGTYGDERYAAAAAAGLPPAAVADVGFRNVALSHRAPVFVMDADTQLARMRKAGEAADAARAEAQSRLRTLGGVAGALTKTSADSGAAAVGEASEEEGSSDEEDEAVAAAGGERGRGERRRGRGGRRPRRKSKEAWEKVRTAIRTGSTADNFIDIGRPRVHVFGVSGAVDMGFIDAVAGLTRGRSHVCTDVVSLRSELCAFHESLSQPIAVGIGLSLGDVDVASYDPLSFPPPDLRVGGEVVVDFEYCGPPPPSVSVHFVTAHGPQTFATIPLKLARAALRPLAVTRRLPRVLASAWLHESPELVSAARALSVESHLPCSLTTLALVEEGKEETGKIKGESSTKGATKVDRTVKVTSSRKVLDPNQQRILALKNKAMASHTRSTAGVSQTAGTVRIIAAAPQLFGGDPEATARGISIGAMLSGLRWRGRLQWWWNRLYGHAQLRAVRGVDVLSTALVSSWCVVRCCWELCGVSHSSFSPLPSSSSAHSSSLQDAHMAVFNRRLKSSTQSISMDAHAIALSIERLQTVHPEIPLPRQWPSRRISEDEFPHLLARMFVDEGEGEESD